eukprot:scaffold5286_cov224-Pinguiococcus_pyrenoidosus.AAC.1
MAGIVYQRFNKYGFALDQKCFKIPVVDASPILPLSCPLSGLAPLLCARSSSTMIRSCDRCCRSVEQTKLWQRWIEKPGLREAYELSLISAVVTFIAFLLGVVLAAVTSSAATLGAVGRHRIEQRGARAEDADRPNCESGEVAGEGHLISEASSGRKIREAEDSEAAAQQKTAAKGAEAAEAPSNFEAFRREYLTDYVQNETAHHGLLLPAGYGLENFVDFCSSLVVIWRFYGNAPPEVLHSREKRASVGIGIMMVSRQDGDDDEDEDDHDHGDEMLTEGPQVILAVVVLGVAVDHVVQANELEGVDILLALAVPSFFIFGILAYMKFYLAQHLRSPALKKDAVCSSAGVVLSGGVLVGAAIFRHHEEVWWFDAAVAIVISTGLLIYGTSLDGFATSCMPTGSSTLASKVAAPWSRMRSKGTDTGLSAGGRTMAER